jgi:hypothetical protein
MMKVVISTILARARLRAPRSKSEAARFRGATMLPSRGGEAIIEATAVSPRGRRRDSPRIESQ